MKPQHPQGVGFWSSAIHNMHAGVRRLGHVSMFICVYLWLIPFSYAQEQITVAVASSFYQQAKVYSTQFEAKHDVKVRLVSGSTGRLFNQIKQGAPFDIFIAADKERPALLNKPSKLIALGFLGLQIGKQFSQDLQQLKQSDIRNIVIPNPEVAPFGKVAKQVLQQAGLWASIKPKLVYAQNAMQAAMMVEQGLTDAGFVPVDNKNALAEVPYVAVLLSDTVIVDSFYRGLGTHHLVIPAQAGIHYDGRLTGLVDSRLRGNDGWSK